MSAPGQYKPLFAAVAVLSRSGRSGHPIFDGALDTELKMRFDSDVLDELRRQAVAMGMNTSAYIRLVLRVKAFGEDHVASVVAERVRSVGVRVGGNVAGEGR